MKISGKTVLAPDDPAILEYIRTSLAYDPDTGIFTWRIRRGCRGAGKEAGCLRKDGYRIIGVYFTEFLAHRLAWFFVNGTWPDGEIDHINCDPSDNRIANLRLATRSQNQQNVPLTRANTSGYKGVIWDASRQLWRAEICVQYKRHYLGRFASKDEAYAAYAEACEKLHGEFARAA